MYSKELSEQVINLRRANTSIKDIAILVNKPETAIRVWLSKHQILKAENKIEIIDALSNEELAYIAGIIDGEGSIIISKLQPNKNKGEINFRYQLSCKVTNTDRRLLEYLVLKTGQPNFADNRKNPNPKSRNTFSIHWPVTTTLHLLQKIYPYLVIKQEQVDLALRFRKTFEDYGHIASPDFIMEERETCYQEMKKLHKREF